jgi:ankyrin repeat protein
MWAKRKVVSFLTAFVTTPLILPLFVPLFLATSNSAAQQAPVAIEHVDLWGHYIRPLRMIHSQDTEARRFGATVVLEVIVSIGGNVESAHAIDGPKKFFSEAEAIERDRQFKPFEQDGIAVRAVIKDWVQIVPLEEWSKTRVPFPEIKDLNTLRMSLTRTSCYGTCPAYSVEVRGNGEVIYRGERSVLITGEHHDRISRQEVIKLLEAFHNADYFSLKDGYSQFVTDVPTYTTAIEFDGRKKSVGDYVGAGAGMPDIVAELEDKIDELAGTEKWLNETSKTWPALVAEHWNFRADTDENRTLFASVAERGSGELVQRFIAAGSPALAMDKDGASPLVNAAEKGNLDLVRRMVNTQAQLPSQVLFRSLRAAAHSGNVDLMEFLISKGADVNGISDNPNDRDTVLIGAASRCKKEAVEETLRYHPLVNAQDFNGDSALSRFLGSCAPGSADVEGIFELLIAAGANVNLKNDQGQTPIFSACFNESAVGLLAQAGADLNAKDKSGRNALMHCVAPEFAKAMIAAGADLNARDREGHTAAEAARDMGNTGLADVLEAAMRPPSKGQQ